MRLIVNPALSVLTAVALIACAQHTSVHRAADLSNVRTMTAVVVQAEEPQATELGASEPDGVDLEASTATCSSVCYRLVAAVRRDVMTPPPEGYESRCLALCTEHASDAQLDCFKRVERLDDIWACAVD